MRPFPPGLRMIAGDADTRSPQSRRVTYWSCGAAGVKVRIGPTAPDCGVLRARMRGVLKVPLIRLQIRYSITQADGVSLASGGQFSAHAD